MNMAMKVGFYQVAAFPSHKHPVSPSGHCLEVKS